MEKVVKFAETVFSNYLLGSIVPQEAVQGQDKNLQLHISSIFLHYLTYQNSLNVMDSTN